MFLVIDYVHDCSKSQIVIHENSMMAFNRHVLSADRYFLAVDFYV